MRKILFKGAASGLIMGIALFIMGAITARLIYGPQMMPDGKFEPEQINVLYFLWTKLVIGLFFGIIFTWIYSKFYSLISLPNVLKGLLFSFILWLIISMWDISHPLMFDKDFINKDRIFWTIYTLSSFLIYGVFIGLIYRK
jgi:uncharacterized membrane protein YeaQ/YmgE (transglycosylase-associated protein family)